MSKLQTPLLSEIYEPPGAEGLREEFENNIQSSSQSSSADSSRKTMNRVSAEERGFEGRIVVELSKQDSSDQELMDSSVMPPSGFIASSEEDKLEEDRLNINRGYNTLPKTYDPVEPLNKGHTPDILSFIESLRVCPLSERLFLYRRVLYLWFHHRVKDSVVCQRDRARTKWEEAALYIYEGEDAKFYHHPGNKWSRRAYELLHHPAYHILHLTVCILLLLLVLIETPAVVDEDMLNEMDRKALVSVHGILEIIFLIFLCLDLTLRFVWLGWNHFIKHRTVIMCVIATVMIIEALAVLIRQKNHIRITRFLRPLFFIDNYYLGGVRRVIRQIFQSIKPIVEVLFLLLFFIILFALFGYIIFSKADPDYFDSFSRSFISLFITLTTANNPNVMMESYGQYPATPIFFIVYIVLTVYFTSNVLLAVVYSSFSKADKKKFKKLIFHKREALHRAFDILGYDPCSDSGRIKFHDFLRFMHHYRPRKAEWQVMCIFKALHKNTQDHTKGLSLEEFYTFYEVIDYKWEEVKSGGEKIQWFTYLPPKIKRPFHGIHVMVTHRFYKFAVGLVVLVNMLFLVIYAAMIKENDEIFSKFQRIRPVSFTFLMVYIADILLNIIGHGILGYFKKFWNLADFFMILFSFICLCLEFYPNFAALVVIRPLKLFRLVRLKRSYRDIMNTLIDLAPRFISIFFLILIIYYIFAIIGLEFLSDLVGPGCCNTSWYNVETYYSEKLDHGDGFFNDTNTVNVYYLNNFDNILSSYVTLFILMVVNNWYIIMEGFTSEVDVKYQWLVRIYFLSFYIIILVVLQVIISFIVEAFVFKIQATQRRRQCSKHPNDHTCNCRQEKKKTVTVTLVEEDISKLRYEVVYLDEQLNRQRRLTLNRLLKNLGRIDFTKKHNRSLTFVGRRVHTKEDIHQLMYKDEIQNWISIYEHNSRRSKKKAPKKAWTSILKEKASQIIDVMVD